jgi:hypothetical protein
MNGTRSRPTGRRRELVLPPGSEANQHGAIHLEERRVDRQRKPQFRGKRRPFAGVWFISSSPDSLETGRSCCRSTRS